MSDTALLSAGVNRSDYSAASPRVALQDADDGATALLADANGGLAFTYQLDGETRTVTLTEDDWSADWRAYVKREGRSESFLWSQYSSAAYMNVVGWAGGTYPDDTSTDADTYSYGHAVFGERTAVGQMPGSGTATYSGRTEGLEWQPSPGQGRANSGNATRVPRRSVPHRRLRRGHGRRSGHWSGDAGRRGRAATPRCRDAVTFGAGRIAGNTLTTTVEGHRLQRLDGGRVLRARRCRGGRRDAGHAHRRHDSLHGWLAGDKD